MAKDNLFLGMARGSVGDVTLYRADGQQLSRARNRHPRNPNSTKQAIQRAISASVARLYSLTRALTDHSFQGLRVGQENQRAFYKRNLSILRALVVTAINDNLADNATDARVSAPGLSVAVPFVGAQMSDGTYDQQLFAYDSSVFGYKLPAPASAEETVAEYAARLGLVAGDIYTFVAIGVDSNSASPLYSLAISNPYASVYQPTFGYVQLLVKSGLSDDITPITGKTFADLFTQAGGTTDITYLAITADVSIDDINTTGSDHGCITCIRSRWDQDLRSTSFLMAGTSEMSYGLTPAYLLAAWRDKLGIDDVELILEGERFNTVVSDTRFNLASVRDTDQDSIGFGFFSPLMILSQVPGQDVMYAVPYIYNPSEPKEFSYLANSSDITDFAGFLGSATTTNIKTQGISGSAGAQEVFDSCFADNTTGIAVTPVMVAQHVDASTDLAALKAYYERYANI